MKTALKSPLTWTIFLAVCVLVGISVWMLTDPKSTRADALRTGGLAAASVVALYALWLNDRRRKVEEARQEIERQRHELEHSRADRDLDRVANERFNKCVELLGNEADQVRVGAFHGLAGLARSRAEYRQTVLDVLCSYLRQPFVRPASEEDVDQQRELVVRQTAQRLISELLPDASDVDGERYNLDLTGATLERFDLAGKQARRLSLRHAQLHRTTRLSGVDLSSTLWLTRATFHGPLELGDAALTKARFNGVTFAMPANFTGAKATGEVSFENAEFQKDAVFTGARFTESLCLRRTSFGDYVDLTLAERPPSLDLYQTLVRPGLENKLPEWVAVEELRNGDFRLTPAQGR